MKLDCYNCYFVYYYSINWPSTIGGMSLKFTDFIRLFTNWQCSVVWANHDFGKINENSLQNLVLLLVFYPLSGTDSSDSLCQKMKNSTYEACKTIAFENLLDI